MNSYSLDSDSSRWWWPQAAAGAVVAAAITTILVIPTTGLALPGRATRDAAPTSLFAPVDPATDRPCFLTRARWNVALDQPQPRCGHSASADRERWTGTLRTGLDTRP